MAFMAITTVITNLERDWDALHAAVDFTQRNNAHLEVLCLGIDRTQPGYYYAGATTVALQSNLQEAKKSAGIQGIHAKSFLETSLISWTTRSVCAQLPGLAQFLAHRMRFCDLAVLPQPYGAGRHHESSVIIEAALFDAKIPVLVVPDSCKFTEPPKRIVVAWNESQEALTAIRLSLPLLKTAEIVNIAMVAPPPHALDRSDPGGALAQLLTRHGVMTEVSILAKTLPRVSDVIARHATDQNADLLVMGAYGHSRLRESILGGATRNTLEMAKLPVFMAH
ncbi:MAG: universal stress protein [Paracoccaceae bacterium]